MKSNKKGFTVVELIIVVAIIAILAAVLIPVFSNVVKTAKTNADVQLVKNLNTVLAAEGAIEGNNKTMSDAIADAKEAGYDVSRLTPTNADNDILWDQTCDRFVLHYVEDRYDVCGKNDDKPVPSGADIYKLWKIYDEAPATNDQTYSVYWRGETLNVTTFKVGFDAGEKSVTEISYLPTASQQEVLIRTNGGTLTVNDAGKNGKVYHYGSVSAANVATDNNCFITYGTVSALNITAGKAVAENGGIIFVSAASNGTFVEKAAGGLVVISESASVDSGAAVSESTAEEKQGLGYPIHNKEQLLAFRDAVNGGADFTGITVKLYADIDMVGYEWVTPIGTSAHPFTGSFDGQNHTILNLSNAGKPTTETFTSITSQQTGNCFGLFGYLWGTNKISNLKISVNTYSSGGNAWAAVAATNKKGSNSLTGETHTTFENITVLEGSTISANAKVGGVIGQAQPYDNGNHTTTFINCVNYANITASSDSNSKVGVISGSRGSVFTNCKNYGNITGAGSFVGGICGDLGGGIAVTKTGNINTGTVTGANAFTLFYDYVSSNKTQAAMRRAYNNTEGNYVSATAGKTAADFWRSQDKYNTNNKLYNLKGVAYSDGVTTFEYTIDNDTYIAADFAVVNVIRSGKSTRGTVKLTGDITISNTNSIGNIGNQSHNINLNGHTLNLGTSGSTDGSSLYATGELNITTNGGEINGKMVIIVKETGETRALTINGDSINYSDLASGQNYTKGGQAFTATKGTDGNAGNSSTYWSLDFGN